MNIPKLEEWIEANQSLGKRAVFKILCLENDGVNLYTKSVSGTRYGPFAITRYEDGYVVTHLKTGGWCADLFSSEKAARRFVWCIVGLYDWKNVRWSKEPPHISSGLAALCKQAYKYVSGVEGQYTELVEHVTSLLPENEDEIEIPQEVVEFGSDKPKKSKPKKPQDSGWGSLVTR